MSQSQNRQSKLDLNMALAYSLVRGIYMFESRNENKSAKSDVEYRTTIIHKRNNSQAVKVNSGSSSSKKVEVNNMSNLFKKCSG